MDCSDRESAYGLQRSYKVNDLDRTTLIQFIWWLLLRPRPFRYITQGHDLVIFFVSKQRQKALLIQAQYKLSSSLEPLLRFFMLLVLRAQFLRNNQSVTQ